MTRVTTDLLVETGGWRDNRRPDNGDQVDSWPPECLECWRNYILIRKESLHIHCSEFTEFMCGQSKLKLLSNLLTFKNQRSEWSLLLLTFAFDPVPHRILDCSVAMHGELTISVQYCCHFSTYHWKTKHIKTLLFLIKHNIIWNYITSPKPTQPTLACHGIE